MRLMECAWIRPAEYVYPIARTDTSGVGKHTASILHLLNTSGILTPNASRPISKLEAIGHTGDESGIRTIQAAPNQAH